MGISPDMDRKTKKVLGFLVGKGLLWTNRTLPPFRGKIMVEDALWVAENAEPRVYEVLPAAMLHFPKTFIGREGIPAELHAIMTDIRRNEIPRFEHWKGIKTKDMVKWANKKLNDKRSKPTSSLKVNKTFRFSPDTIERLKFLSSKMKIAETEVLERLIHQGKE